MGPVPTVRLYPLNPEEICCVVTLLFCLVKDDFSAVIVSLANVSAEFCINQASFEKWKKSVSFSH